MLLFVRLVIAFFFYYLVETDTAADITVRILAELIIIARKDRIENYTEDRGDREGSKGYRSAGDRKCDPV